MVFYFELILLLCIEKYIFFLVLNLTPVFNIFAESMMQETTYASIVMKNVLGSVLDL